MRHISTTTEALLDLLARALEPRRQPGSGAHSEDVHVLVSRLWARIDKDGRRALWEEIGENEMVLLIGLLPPRPQEEVDAARDRVREAIGQRIIGAQKSEQDRKSITSETEIPPAIESFLQELSQRGGNDESEKDTPDLRVVANQHS